MSLLALCGQCMHRLRASRRWERKLKDTHAPCSVCNVTPLSPRYPHAWFATREKDGAAEIAEAESEALL